VPRLIKVALERAKVSGGTSGVDVVGDIAIVRFPELSLAEKRRVAKTLIEEMKNVRVVVEQEGGIEGEYRLRNLRYLAGEKRTETVHRENGCAFRVDIAKCYFSPRLSTERLRVAEEVSKKERVLNMFAGVGPYSILMAKMAGARVVSCELNKLAAKLHLENDVINKVANLVTVIQGDARDLPKITEGKFDRILMPLPAGADKFLPVALRLIRKGGTVHYYRHLLGENEDDAAEALRQELEGFLPDGAKYTSRRVREVGPRWVEMTAEIRMPR
jgi:tRNA (guanine37-N1)-methyltransferase